MNELEVASARRTSWRIPGRLVIMSIFQRMELFSAARLVQICRGLASDPRRGLALSRNRGMAG